MQTQLTHSLDPNEGLWGETVVPIYQTTAFQYGTAQELADVFAGRAPGYNYTRVGNPTTAALEQRLAGLEGGIGCIATASGMGAIAAVAMALLGNGDHAVVAHGIFAGTISLFADTLARCGVDTTFVNAGDTDAVADAVTDRTRLILVESIGNPKLDVPDLPAIRAMAVPRAIPLVVDHTALAGSGVTAKAVGADVVVLSTSKFVNGHGTAIGGAIVDTGTYDWSVGPAGPIRDMARKAGPVALLAYLRNVVHRNLGACAAPFSSFLMLHGLVTLKARMDRHVENARGLAPYLAGRKAVAWVRYPGLAGDPYHERIGRVWAGSAGAVLTFGLGSRERAFRFIDSVRLARQAANIGDARTLVIHPASTIFHAFDPDRRKAMGVFDDMVRVSVGLEDLADIQADFEQAMDKA